MDPADLISELEHAPSMHAARSLLRGAAGTHGMSRAFFTRIATLLGSDPASARRLGAYWPLVLRYGDEASFAYRARGVFHRLHGQWAESAEAFRLAGKHAKDPLEKLSFQAGAVDGFGRAGKVDDAVRLGKRLSKGLDKLGDRGNAARVKLNVGNALLWADRYRQARSWLEEAAPDLSKAGLSVEAASATLGLSTAHLFGGNPAEANRFALSALNAFRSADLGHFAALADINRAQVMLLSGRPDDAMTTLINLRDKLDAEPFERARTEEFLGNAYRALNMSSEASDCYRLALQMHRKNQPNLNRANCLLGLGLAAIEAEDPFGAAIWLNRARAEYENFGNSIWAAAAESSLAKCRLQTGAYAKALELADHSTKRLSTASSPYLYSEALLERASATVARKQNPSDDLNKAWNLIRRNGYVQMEWRVHLMRARSSSEPACLRHYARMVDSILQSRLLVSSAVSRSYFLRDKADALSEYVALLLSRPGMARVRNALDVIRNTRSVALADEILSARSDLISESARSEIEALRQELSILAAPPTPGQERRAGPSRSAVARLQRKWIEAGHSAIANLSPFGDSGDSNVNVLVETRDCYFAIQNDTSTKLGLSPKELHEKLKWLRFDLLAPMADPSHDPTSSLRSIREIKNALVDPWIRSDHGVLPLSPDQTLWQVPWQIILNAEICSVEPSLLPSATFRSDASQCTLPKSARVAIWYCSNADLPNVQAEADALLAQFPSAKTARTIQEIKALMEEGEWDLLHVAGHAKFNSENPMFSYISFEDGPLFADEIARSRLRAKLVALSACDTGCVSMAKKTEPDGLARAFLARGAQSVLATSWQLDDRTARDTMHSFYAALKAGGTVAGALNHARSQCREARPHPYYWGCWVLFGGYEKCSVPQNGSAVSLS